MCVAVRSRGVFGISPGDGIEGERHVNDRLRDRANCIIVGIERHHAGAADKSAGCSNRGQRREAGGVRKRVALIGAERDWSEARGNGIPLPPLDPAVLSVGS